MDTKSIYELANKLTEKQVIDIVSEWKTKNETENIKTFNTLVRLGDSKQLACATIMLSKPIDNETKEFYKFAYEN